MIVAALCIALGGVRFEKIDLPELYVAPPDRVLGISAANFRHADLDADGHLDVLFATRVYLRPNGHLDPDRFIKMPDVAAESRLDVWESTLYVLSHSLLATYELRGNDWNRTNIFEYDGDLGDGFDSEFGDRNPAITLERFLHDVDGDGRPEIVRVDEAGLAIGRMLADRVETTHLNLYPAPHLLPHSKQNTFWPESDRRISLPNRSARFEIVVSGESAVVVDQIQRGQDETVFAIERYRIIAGGPGGFRLQAEASHRTVALPSFVGPSSLNNDGMIDYAGYRYDQPTYASWKPRVQSFASTDGGKTVQMAVSRGFRSRALFADIDGDGDQDWIGEESGLVSGGIRETVKRALLQRKISHTIMARMQDDDGTFARRWVTLGRFTIRLDEPAGNYSYRFWQYRMGDLVDCTGDFDADGWRDVLVYKEPESVSLHLGGPDGFSAQAEAKFSVPPHSIPIAIDIDGDGRSDVAVKKHDMTSPVAIYLNRGGAK